MASRRRPDPSPYFETLRIAAARLPEGLVRLGDPTSEAEVHTAEQSLGRPLPRTFAEFLRSFDGADLFHEGLLIYGASARALRRVDEANRASRPELIHPDELLVAETPTGDLFVLEADDPESGDEPRVFRLRADADERWLAGSTFARWLEATVAHEQLLYDEQGEFMPDAFEEDGEELTAKTALRQAERALHKDPGSALLQHELGLAHRRLGREGKAREAFAAAAALDPANPWPWFDLGRSERALGQASQAAAAFESAAEATSGPQSARFLAWAARSFMEAGDRATAERLRAEALSRHPTLGEEMRRAAEADLTDEDGGGSDLHDAGELAALLDGNRPLTRRLPVLGESVTKAEPARTKAPAPLRKPDTKATTTRANHQSRPADARPRKDSASKAPATKSHATSGQKKAPARPGRPPAASHGGGHRPPTRKR